MTAQPNDADRHLHLNPGPEAVEAGQRPEPPRSRQVRPRPSPEQPGQSARLARRAAIRAQRQAERRAQQRSGRQSGSLAGPLAEPLTGSLARPQTDLQIERQRATRLAKVNQPDRLESNRAESQPSASKLATLKSRSQAAGVDAAAVHPFRPKQSVWLTLLVWLQRGSGVVTLVLVVAALITYGWTVYTQELWGKEFDKLESLKKKERQLVSANEVLKNQMAEQAEKPTAGLLLPDPSNAIFLTPAPQRPPVKPRPVAPGNEPDPIRPLGY